MTGKKRKGELRGHGVQINNLQIVSDDTFGVDEGSMAVGDLTAWPCEDLDPLIA